jgi:dolichol-phosphate mannosyltransferase
MIPKLVEKWREGYEVVYGVRASREGEDQFKLWSARAFYRLINKLSEVPIPLDTGDFRLMDRRVVEVMRAMPERHRLLRGMTSWVGFRQTAVPYERPRRFAGTSKYPLTKMLTLALDGIVSFSVVPLKLLTIAGAVLFALSILGITYAIVLRLFTDIWVPGWTLLFISSLSIGGLQFMSLGILGEYIGRIYGEVKGRPLFVVAEGLGHVAWPGRKDAASDRVRPVLDTPTHPDASR